MVVGGNRGIGLELCRQVQRAGYDVLAACRSSSEELDGLSGVQAVPGVDVGRDGGCEPLVQAVASSSRPVDLLICNAGLLVVDTYDTLGQHFSDIEQQFQVNAMGPLRVCHALRHHLRQGSKVLILTSAMGSMERATGNMYGYRMSKAASNMAGRCLAGDLKEQGVAVALIHPGVVNTDMYKTYNEDQRTAPKTPRPPALSPVESVAGMLKVMEGLSMENSGGFWSYDGSTMAW